ncbi:RNA polymerase sigma factor [Bacillus sp. FJAT-28004]|uniref:RNA polymerase sigma factor n=1 Tax=Bacillus sp. FJAT-28004 TaxID=1679165 RepID=UPI0006B4EF82|nr:RNA polymerase sigma factor [Bacillus sp. FJAT-28004]
MRESVENVRKKMRAEQSDEADDVLVCRARAGDHVAFGELVHRHRAKAYGFAFSMAQDTYLADDIVQEALVGAFIRLGSLLEPSRFGPWLQRIVRNQAYMRLRRGGPYGKERPLSSYKSSSSESDRGDAEAVLFHLSRSASERQDLSPEERLVRMEMLRGLRDMLHCLSPRERDVFEAHFYRELQPKEIAELFRTTVTNVYNHLFRSRTKLQREHIRVHVAGYVQFRQALGKPQKRILDEFGKRF